MKRYLFFAACLVGVVIQGFGQTQPDRDAKAARSLDKAEKELNVVYQKILKEYAGDTVFIRKLRISQRIWLQFRQAELDMKYPAENPMEYGSIWRWCYANYKEGLTLDRIKTLKEWLEAKEEGDVCSGSVKIITKKQSQ